MGEEAYFSRFGWTVAKGDTDVEIRHVSLMMVSANYDLISDEWISRRKELPPKDRELFDFFIDSLPDDGRILDLGCGSGIPIAKLLIEKGFSVLGVDCSERLLRNARESLPAGVFHKDEIEEYEIKGGYDGVVLWDTIFHIRREYHRAILEKVYRSLVAGGTVILSSGGSEEDLPPFTDFMFGVEFFYDAFSPTKLLSLVEDIGFTVEKYAVVNQPDGGRDKGRIGVVLSKG